jgi:hypothetical protein
MIEFLLFFYFFKPKLKLGGKQIEIAASPVNEKSIHWLISQRFDNQINRQFMCKYFQGWQQFGRGADRVNCLGSLIEVQTGGPYVIKLYGKSHKFGADIGGPHLETASLQG